MAEHKGQFRLCSMRRVLRIERSGYHVWKAQPKSKRTLTDEFLLASIKRSFDNGQGFTVVSECIATYLKRVFGAGENAWLD